MTTAVTLLSMQKYVPDRFAYCSENLRITSRFFDTTADPSSCEEDVVADSEDVVSARIFTENRPLEDEERVLRHPDKSLEGDEDVLMEVGVRTTDMDGEASICWLEKINGIPPEGRGPPEGEWRGDDEAEKIHSSGGGSVCEPAWGLPDGIWPCISVSGIGNCDKIYYWLVRLAGAGVWLLGLASPLASASACRAVWWGLPGTSM